MLHDEAHGETSFQMLLVYEDPFLGLKSDNGPHCGGRSNKATNGQISRSYQAIEQTAVARMLRFWNALYPLPPPPSLNQA